MQNSRRESKTEGQQFQDFEAVLEHYHYDFRFQPFIDFSSTTPIPAETWFKEELMFALSHRGDDDKEAFACEFLIVPFLRYVWRRHELVNLFSHVQIKADDLIFIPDYLVTGRTPTGFKRVYKPLLLTVEAKNEDFGEGWFKALLQAVVCQRLNETPDIPIVMVVTTGDVWQFGKLEQTHVIRHPLPLSIEDPDMLLGVLDVVFAGCEQLVSGENTPCQKN